MKSKFDLGYNNKNSDSFSSITLGILSPEQILERSFGEVLSQKLLIIDLISQKKMDYSVRKYLVLLKIGNVIVENIKELDIEELYVIGAV